MSTGVPLLSAVESKTEDVTACIACGKWIKISKNRREHDLELRTQNSELFIRQ